MYHTLLINPANLLPGISTLLHSIDSNVATPANLDDEAFDENTSHVKATEPINIHVLSIS